MSQHKNSHTVLLTLLLSTVSSRNPDWVENSDNIMDTDTQSTIWSVLLLKETGANMWQKVTVFVIILRADNNYMLCRWPFYSETTWHLVISNNNKYCFEQYLFYLFSHLQEFFQVMHSKEERKEKKKHPISTEVEMTPLLWLCLHFVTIYPEVFSYVSQDIAMWAQTSVHEWTKLNNQMDSVDVTRWRMEECNRGNWVHAPIKSIKT